MLKRIRQQWKTYMGRQPDGGGRMHRTRGLDPAGGDGAACQPLVVFRAGCADPEPGRFPCSTGSGRTGSDGSFTRVWYGAGISLTVGIASALINGAIGELYGAVSGFAGRLWI